MTSEPADRRETDSARKRSLFRRTATVIAALLCVYATIAYVVTPSVWKRYVQRHPSLADVPGITCTKAGIPGDPLNVALVGTENEVKRAMLAADWHPANPLTLKSCLKIAADTVFDRAYVDAPVSNLYLWGRKEDLAFEQPVGDNPRKRHHVRFWRSQIADGDGRPIWIGSVTYDDRVGLSRTTGQVTHHIAADVDAERDRLMQTLQKANQLSEVYYEDHFHKTLEGRNGGGDLWRTDGRLAVGVIAADPSINR